MQKTKKWWLYQHCSIYVRTDKHVKIILEAWSDSMMMSVITNMHFMHHFFFLNVWPVKVTYRCMTRACDSYPLYLRKDIHTCSSSILYYLTTAGYVLSSERLNVQHAFTSHITSHTFLKSNLSVCLNALYTALKNCRVEERSTLVHKEKMTSVSGKSDVKKGWLKQYAGLW